MGFTEYLERVRAEVEGDAFFRLLKSNLAAGHRVQQVSFVAAEGAQPARYRFLLARLGTLTTVDVPAGQPAVERLLSETKQKLATREDEVARCHLRLRHAREAVAKVLGQAAAREAALLLCQDVGGPVSSREAGGSARPALSPPARLAAEQLRREFDGRVRELYVERGYPLAEAGIIADEGLARLISAG